MSTAGIIVLIIVVVVAALAVAGWRPVRRRTLQRRFGPEYDRVVAEQPNRAAAERELRERERKHAELELKPLAPDARARYAAEWAKVQARFVDSPSDAVRDGDELVTRLVGDIGYPTDSDDERLALLSVEHAGTFGRYRDAHEISLRNARGEASTEQLRRALVQYRALFAELLGDPPVPQTGEPLGVGSVATGSAADHAINNTVPMPVPGNAPRSLS
ncbi:hypothetical protein [Phytohabitans rumicis]|uniref:Secreted protein n=1 Tax=Phytohabitans rumicis TaxID=1076125 RepID=A0A6V8LFJ0_9ACTN|nr:hypothetical protein [Phytohabitans rumicis]GFJ96032.1 hypothetical protein Prum_096740 [Phytohabitans rumicis]